MAYYGRRISSGGDSDYGYAGAGSPAAQQAQVYNPITEHGWAYAVGAWGGKYEGSSATWRGAIWAAAGSAPGALLGRTGTVTVTTAMTHGSQGLNQLSNLEAPVMLWSGTSYAIGWNISAGVYSFGMSQAANSPSGPATYYFHRRNASAPTNPFGATSSSYEGAQDSFIEYEPNVAPTVTTTGMAPSGTINTTSPTFTGKFADANSDRGDKLKQFQIIVERVDTGAAVWSNTYSADSTEQANQAFSQAYAGTALVAGVSYRWRYRVSDQFGVWSSYSSYVTFMVNGGGSVSTSSGSPSGKQETNTPGPFTAVWSHVSALSTNQVELRIKQGSTVVRTKTGLAKTVANNGTISITWAESGFSALSWGGSYTYEIRARDTGNLWSAWSAGRAFTTNAAPTIPAIIAPKGGLAMTSRPLLRATSTDADDTTSTGFAVSARIKNSAGSVLFTRAMTYNTTAKEWRYQTTSTDLASFAQYSWDAVATDGTLTSSYSEEASFTYGEGPSITITGPTGTISTNTPNVTFTQTSTQASYRVELYEWVNGAVGERVYDSGTVTSSAAAGATVTHPIPSGALHNNTEYVAKVTSTSTLSLVGTEWGTSFLLSFPAYPAPTGLMVSPILVGNDVRPSALMASWDDPGISSDIFLETVIARRPEGTPLLDAEVLQRFTSPEQTIFVDYYPASGQSFIYTVFFMVLQGTDATESELVEAGGSVTLEHVVINSAVDGQLSVGLRYGQPMRTTHMHDEVKVYPWGQSKGHTMRGLVHEHMVSGVYELQNDRYSTGLQDLSQLVALDELGDTVCYRDQYGERIFGDMTLSTRKGQRGMVAEATVTIAENDHREGI